jgi:hypothetical protein
VLGLGEDALAARALNVEAQDAEGGDLQPLALARMADELVPRNVRLYLCSTEREYNINTATDLAR